MEISVSEVEESVEEELPSSKPSLALGADDPKLPCLGGLRKNRREVDPRPSANFTCFS